MSNSKVQQLVEALSKLPGIGPRQATRIVLSLVRWEHTELDSLSNAVAQLKDGVKLCTTCHNLSEDGQCNICANTSRNRSAICVVEKIPDLQAIEKTGLYKGVYHILGGTINPLDNVLPENLNIGTLIKRIQTFPSAQVEVIIATNPNTYGEATAFYLEDKLKPFNIKVTRLGRGLSAGSFLEYADEITLHNAFKNRK